jgi:hypothetical protein
MSKAGFVGTKNSIIMRERMARKGIKLLHLVEQIPGTADESTPSMQEHS